MLRFVLCTIFLWQQAFSLQTTKSVPLRRTRLFGANKLDGLPIDGDLQPVNNNILVKVKEVASSTSGGLFIPDNAKERPTEGMIPQVPPLFQPLIKLITSTNNQARLSLLDLEGSTPSLASCKQLLACRARK
jgi:hypothetical protein